MSETLKVIELDEKLFDEMAAADRVIIKHWRKDEQCEFEVVGDD